MSKKTILLGAACLAMTASIFGTLASAYIGPSFLQISGVNGGWPGAPYKNWVKVSAHYWKTTPLGNFARRQPSRLFYSGPTAPRQGASEIVIAIDKGHPALAQLMDRCAKKTSIPDVMYAESAELSRDAREVGERPADVPEYFEYKLTDVQLSDCPVVADAPEQAFVVTFKDIQWLNYRGEGMGQTLTLAPAVLPPAESSGQTKAFVVSWIGVAHDVSGDQCQVASAKPTEDEYYALMSKEEAARERARFASKGGPQYDNGEFCFRGPHQLNACRLPGIVRDPGLPAPHTTVGRGFNLDGDDGTGNPPPGVTRHANFVSEDGRTRGIDNQLYTVEGCMSGRVGHKGQLVQYANEQRRNGLNSMLVVISGIDNEQNDDRVDVTLLASKDPMAKNATGAEILSDYTFRVTDNPEYSHYFRRLHGRIVNGAVVLDPMKELQIHAGFDALLTLRNAQMRLEFPPDGTLKGIAGGYDDWRRIATNSAHSQQESLWPTHVPGYYNALKRAADGLKDPVSGEYHGISVAHDIEGVPAFIPPDQLSALLEGRSPSFVVGRNRDAR